MTTSKPRSGKRRSFRGALTVIAALLFSSAVVRLGSGAGAAVANASESLVENNINAVQPQPASTNIARSSRAEIGALLNALQDRERHVEAQEKKMNMRAKALSIADTEIEKRLIALKQAETNLRNTLSLADGAAEDDIARLTAVYENMKPKDAAAVFGAMAPDFAAGFLSRMRPDSAAAVMSGLTPDVAYSISVILAGRNANAPKD